MNSNNPNPNVNNTTIPTRDLTTDNTKEFHNTVFEDLDNTDAKAEANLFDGKLDNNQDVEIIDNNQVKNESDDKSNVSNLRSTSFSNRSRTGFNSTARSKSNASNFKNTNSSNINNTNNKINSTRNVPTGMTNKLIRQPHQNQVPQKNLSKTNQTNSASRLKKIPIQPQSLANKDQTQKPQQQTMTQSIINPLPPTIATKNINIKPVQNFKQTPLNNIFPDYYKKYKLQESQQIYSFNSNDVHIKRA